MSLAQSTLTLSDKGSNAIGAQLVNESHSHQVEETYGMEIENFVPSRVSLDSTTMSRSTQVCSNFTNLTYIPHGLVFFNL